MLRLKRILLRIAAAAAAVYVVLCVLVYFFQEKLIFLPQKLPDGYAFHFDAPFREMQVKSPSGNRIHALYFPAENPKALVVYFHGNAGCLKGWGERYRDFIPRNYSLLISDYAGYGKSEGELSEAALFTDAQAVYDSAKALSSENRIVVYGRSLGTGVAAQVAATNSPSRLVLESPYYSMQDVSKHLYPFLPSFLLRYPIRTDRCFPQIHCPVTIVHGTADEVVYFESSLKLKQLFRPGDRLCVVEGGHHNDLPQFEAYQHFFSEIFP